jgi:peptide/nickel transport system permease protein
VTTARAKAGIVVPGLGHLLSGQVIEGVGLLALTVALAYAAAHGFPHLDDLLARPGTPTFRIHPYVALCGWFLIAILTWYRAFRFAVPQPPPSGHSRASQARAIWRQFKKSRSGMMGLYLVLVIVTVAILTPLIAPFDPDALEVGPKLAPPSFEHWMGTDEFRRDVFSRVMYGARISLSIGFVAVVLAATIGTVVGSVAGYFGGWTDRLLMWCTDLVLSLPRLVLLLAIIGFFRAAGAQSLFLIVTVLGLTGWMGVARIVRSQVLSLKEQDFIQATKALGLPTSRVLFVHLIPNAFAPVIVFASLAIGNTILTEAALSFLGLGVPPPTSTWGSIVNAGREYIRSAWWITMFPGLMIVFSVMSFNMLGDGLRDALDPKLRGR